MAMRLLIAAGFLLLSVSGATREPDELLLRLARFHRHYDPLFRQAFGCEEGAIDPKECFPSLGTFNSKEFLEARREAKELFGLR